MKTAKNCTIRKKIKPTGGGYIDAGMDSDIRFDSEHLQDQTLAEGDPVDCEFDWDDRGPIASKVWATGTNPQTNIPIETTPEPESTKPAPNKVFIDLPTHPKGHPEAHTLAYTKTAVPIWHNGNNPNQKMLISGCLRCSLTTLTPTLVGNHRYPVTAIDGARETPDSTELPPQWVNNPEHRVVENNKAAVEPIRLPDQQGCIIINASALNGMLRQTLGALTASPIERTTLRNAHPQSDCYPGRSALARSCWVKHLGSALPEKEVAENTSATHSKPKQLTPIRRMRGYVSNPDTGTKNIAKGRFERMAGRFTCISAIEQIKAGRKDDHQRFLNPDQKYAVFLKKMLGPMINNEKNEEKYFDDVSRKPKGRAFYNHQPEAAHDPRRYEIGKDHQSGLAAIARFISVPDTEFRFELNFKDLEDWELGLLLLCLDPQLIENTHWAEQHSNKEYLQEIRDSGESKEEMFGHKIGMGRPLGLGSVAIHYQQENCEFWHANGQDIAGEDNPQLIKDALNAGVTSIQDMPIIKDWLAVHRYRGQKTYGVSDE